jgi:hypothetical protein
VRVSGINFITIDCEPDYAGWWERWYDQDHIPEFLAHPGVTHAHRYRATPELVAARPPTAVDGLADGLGAYCTIIGVGPDDAGADAGREAMAAVHNRLMPVPGRMPDWDRIAPRFIEGYDLTDARPGAGVPVAVDALAHLRHGGVLAELHDPDADPAVTGDGRDAILAVPGVLAGLRFAAHPLPFVEAPWEEGTGAPPDTAPAVPRLDLYLLEPDPADLVDALLAAAAAGAASCRFHGTWRTT